MFKYRGKKPVFFILLFAGVVLLIFLLLQPIQVRYWGAVSLLNAKGPIALKQRNLLLIIQGIMLFVVIPVYLLTFAFSWQYQAHNEKAKHTPDWDHHKLAEYIWWGVPFLMIVAIGALTWVRTYQLDPFRPLESDKPPQKIQVVALQWKWLFIYPEEKIAVVNFLEFPEKTPVNFEITSDAPMNSFWIPQLAGQIYAMPKMRTKLHLMADEQGEFRGCSANISGKGFSGMHFIAKATSDEEFQQWIQHAQGTVQELTFEEYQKLTLPSENNPVTLYKLKDENLFEQIIMKYMQPQS